MNGDDLNIANYGMCCKVLCRRHITYHILNNEPITAYCLSLNPSKIHSVVSTNGDSISDTNEEDVSQ